MRQLIILSFASLLCLLFTSCWTSEKFYVYGTPGTEIYTSYFSHMGSIENSGKVKVKISSGSRCAYLLYKDKNTNSFVPFALDFKKCNHSGTRFAHACAWAVFPIGWTWGLPMSMRLQQKSYKYNYKYAKKQYTNQDLPLTQPVYTEPEKIRPANKTSDQMVSEDLTGSQVPASSSKSRKHISQTSTKTFKDYAAQIEGDYIGSGSLLLDSKMIESYSNIIVKITRKSRDVVSVNVVEANGESFFEQSSDYKITQRQDSSYELMHTSINAASIIIDESKGLLYLHPKVNIDGYIYTLRINASLYQK